METPTALRRRLEIESERLRKAMRLREEAARDAYERGFREGVAHERARVDRAMILVREALAEMCRDAEMTNPSR